MPFSSYATPNETSYFRAMSSMEYDRWRQAGRIGPLMEWAVKNIYLGYPLETLKEWVDDESKSHDLVVRVTSADPWEFSLATRNDRFGIAGVDGGSDMLPRRYLNRRPIAFSRAGIAYDPRPAVSGTPVRELEALLAARKRTGLRRLLSI